MKERGAAIVEFALVLPLFLLIMFLAIYGALWLHDVNALNELTRSAVRYGVVETSGETPQRKYESIDRYISNNNVNTVCFLYGDDLVDIDVNGLEVNGEIEEVKENDEPCVRVTIKGKKDAELPIIINSFIPEQISSTLTMRIE